MISWKHLIYCIKELEKLENGGGSEIEFEFKGVSYGITSYRDSCEISRFPDINYDYGLNKIVIKREYPTYTYSSLRKLGEAKDIGFSVKKEWNNIESLVCKPDFEETPLVDILDSYKKALKNK